MTISRRGFIASAGMLLLPSWLITKPKIRHVDLSLFCDAGSASFQNDCSKPFRQSGLNYATDGRVCVRTPLPLLTDALGEEVRLPKADALPWWDHDNCRGWKPWGSAITVPEKDGEFGKWLYECPVCFRKGRLNGHKHKQCEGTGYKSEYDECRCKTGWVGGFECPECKGRGEVDYAKQLVGGVYIAPAYHAKVATLGEVEYCVVDKEHAVRFRGQDVDGLLMPLSI